MQSRPMPPEQALPRITALLEAGSSCRLVVTGNSMLPFLRHKRDAVILSPLSEPARRGDILFYLRGISTIKGQEIIEEYLNNSQKENNEIINNNYEPENAI